MIHLGSTRVLHIDLLKPNMQYTHKEITRVISQISYVVKTLVS